jgi:23S rRNA (guanine745-N1)-methyltransferase
VRNCGLPLERRDRAVICSSGHSFDIARSGYINLLQPQDRRSASAGDSKVAIDARVALEQAGIGRAAIDSLIEKVGELDLPAHAVVVDLGSGSGEILGGLSNARSVSGVGIDLSAAAVDLAARRFPTLTWIVANADRRLPLQDESVDLVLSIQSRRNPAECARVLTAAGHLVVAVPAPDDLIELRALVQGQATERDRVETMLGEHLGHFDLMERFTIREQNRLEREALLNLLRSTYRGARFGSSAVVDAIQPMAVTLSSDVCVLRRRKNRGGSEDPPLPVE